MARLGRGSPFPPKIAGPPIPIQYFKNLNVVSNTSVNTPSKSVAAFKSITSLSQITYLRTLSVLRLVMTITLGQIQAALVKSLTLGFTNGVSFGSIKNARMILGIAVINVTSYIKQIQPRVLVSGLSLVSYIPKQVVRVVRIIPNVGIKNIKLILKSTTLSFFSLVNNFVPRIKILLLTLIVNNTTSIFRQVGTRFQAGAFSTNSLFQGIGRVFLTPVGSTLNYIRGISSRFLVTGVSTIVVNIGRVKFLLLTIGTIATTSLNKSIQRILSITGLFNISVSKFLSPILGITPTSIINLFKNRPLQLPTVLVNSGVFISFGKFYTKTLAVITTTTTSMSKVIGRNFSVAITGLVNFGRKIGSIYLVPVNSLIQQAFGYMKSILVNVTSHVLVSKIISMYGNQIVVNSIAFLTKIHNQQVSIILNNITGVYRVIKRTLGTSSFATIFNSSSGSIKVLLSLTVSSTTRAIRGINTRLTNLVVFSTLNNRKIIQRLFGLNPLASANVGKTIGQRLYTNIVTLIWEGTPKVSYIVVNALSSINLTKQIQRRLAGIQATTQFTFRRILSRRILTPVQNAITQVKGINKISKVLVRPTSTPFKKITKSLQTLISGVVHPFKQLQKPIVIQGISTSKGIILKLYGILRVKQHKTINFTFNFDIPVDAWVVKLDTGENYASGTTLASYSGNPVTSGTASFSSDLLLPGSNDIKVYGRTAGTQIWTD